MPGAKNKGYLCLVLHAHLPYVRHPEHEFFLEENWLFEAITETYIPLLDLFSRLVDDGVDFRVTLSLSPPLLEMFSDALLRERYSRYLERLIELSEREVRRTRRDIHFGPVAKMYRERFRTAHGLFHKAYRKDLSAAFRELQESGRVRIITTTATHAFLPLLAGLPKAVRGQIRIGVKYYRKVFDTATGGMWLPECGFAPGFDRYLSDEGIRYFFLDAHGIACGRPSPQVSVYEPAACPSGVMAFGRDPETSEQVWSSAAGYPGDPDYRDFYRDIGFDLDLDYVRSYLKPFAAKTFTGLKYYRITGKSGAKRPYVKGRADKKAGKHARHFISEREKQIQRLSENHGIRPVINAIYDAELFGHWWSEGTEWLNRVLRGIHERQGNLTTITPEGYMEEIRSNQLKIQRCEPLLSSWGERGYSEVWVNRSNDYTCRHILKAAERMIRLAEKFPRAEGLLKRALNQAAREVLLSQHSDWPFIINAGTAKEYAAKRFEEHISRFSRLYKSILNDDIPEQWLAEVEQKDNIFRDIDYLDFNQA
jgi:1,4-alpha-glucan branching enzyme